MESGSIPPPPEDIPSNKLEVIDSGAGTHPQPTAADRLLLIHYPATTTIGKAARGTVAIISALGSGSGIRMSSVNTCLDNFHG